MESKLGRQCEFSEMNISVCEPLYADTPISVYPVKTHDQAETDTSARLSQRETTTGSVAIAG